MEKTSDSRRSAWRRRNGVPLLSRRIAFGLVFIGPLGLPACWSLLGGDLRGNQAGASDAASDADVEAAPVSDARADGANHDAPSEASESADGPFGEAGDAPLGDGQSDADAASPPPPGTLIEFPVPSGGCPTSIVMGPDGSVWFTEYQANRIGRMTATGVFTEFSGLSQWASPGAITVGPDGAIWFTENTGIGRITTDGGIQEFPVDGGPLEITKGPDGAVWFTISTGGQGIGRITTAGTTVYFAGGPSNPWGPTDAITQGPDDALWFTIQGSNPQIGRLAMDGGSRTFVLDTDGGLLLWPDGITSGPDDNLWFTDMSSSRVGWLRPDGGFGSFFIDGGAGTATLPWQITSGPDGALWFLFTQIDGIDGGAIGRITTAGVFSPYALPPTTDGGALPNPGDFAWGPDGSLWFSDQRTCSIGRIVP